MAFLLNHSHLHGGWAFPDRRVPGSKGSPALPPGEAWGDRGSIPSVGCGVGLVCRGPGVTEVDSPPPMGNAGKIH